MIKEILKSEVQHFQFEEDFIEDNIRCIPMIVRFKLDAVGIKLKLAEWSRLSKEERSTLASEPCSTAIEIAMYRSNLQKLVRLRAGNEVTDLSIEATPA